MKHLFGAGAIIVLTAGLACAQSSSGDLTKALTGATLVSGPTTIMLGKDGALNGKTGKDGSIELTGTWMIDGGKFCRTLTKPERLAGSTCQTAKLDGKGMVTIEGNNGPVTYEIK